MKKEMSKIVCGIDCETYDPKLKTAGWSWKYHEGYILCTSIFYENLDEVKIIPGIHNDNCTYSEEERINQNEIVKDLLKNENVIIIGANIIYDIGWLLYEYNMTTYDVKAKLIDVLMAQRILDEWTIHSLESLSLMYLGYGKQTSKIEPWIKEHVSSKGDFRQHLKEAPYDLLLDYVAVDSKNPVKIWKKQLTLLKNENLVQRVKLEFSCILPILQITINGFCFNVEGKKENLKLLTKYRDILKESFLKNYNLDKFNVNSSQHIASLCDTYDIPYKYKITLKTYEGKNIDNLDYLNKVYNIAKKIIVSIRKVKNQLVAFVPSGMVERTVDLLEEEGFTCNASPNVDKKFFEVNRDKYEVIDIIANWKLANGIISKILGEKYDRFITKDNDGVCRIHSQFNISDTVTFRLSSQQPNCITSDNRLLTPSGYVALKNLKEGDAVYNGNGDLTTIKNIWYKGKKKCISLVSDNGNKIVLTSDHKLWNGKNWEKAGEIEYADIIESSNGTSYRNTCRVLTCSSTRTSHRQEYLKQQLGQLGSCYTISSQKVTQADEGIREVYDIEVESSDHSFIAEGYRVKNCQQIPSKGALKLHDIELSFPALTRALFQANPNQVLWKIDYGQIEYRLICNIAVGDGAEEVRAEFAKNPKLDFHQYVVDLTGLSRKFAKNMSFGVSFGLSLASMAENFGWTLEHATEIAEQYHEHMPFVLPTLTLIGDIAKERGYIRTVCGSHARLQNESKSYTMLNRYTQGSGAEILKTAITQAYEEGLWKNLGVVNTIHDELVGSVDVNFDRILDVYKMAHVMRTCVKLRVPLEAEPEFGDNWASTKTVREWIEEADKNSESWIRASKQLKETIRICKIIEEQKLSYSIDNL